MNPDRRSHANRLNAQKSTGPKTSEGKRRAAKNARCHGLSLPVTSHPELSEDVLRLARIIAGEGKDPRRLEAALRIAEPQIDLIRLQRARLSLLIDPVAHDTSRATEGKKLKASTSLRDRPTDTDTSGRLRDINNGERGKAAAPLEVGLEFLATRLMRLDRYERRAFSRRKKAIRAFDQLEVCRRSDNKRVERDTGSHICSSTISQASPKE